MNPSHAPGRVATVAAKDRRRALVALLLIVVAACAIWIARAPLLRGAAVLWVVSDPLSPADAVVVLGGRVDLRPFAAADIYKRGFAKQVLIVGVEQRELALDRGVLLRLGVPAEAIAPFGEHVASTYDEARALLAWASETGAKRVIVPTDLFHTRRVKWLFTRELSPAGVEVDVLALTPSIYNLTNWWRHELGLIHFKNEVLKYIGYRIRYGCVDPFGGSEFGQGQ